jgi:hypothetical protein
VRWWWLRRVLARVVGAGVCMIDKSRAALAGWLGRRGIEAKQPVPSVTSSAPSLPASI